MHELPAVEDLIGTLDETAREKEISGIKEINIVIGELSSYVGECVQMYFDLLSEGHACEGAVLNFRPTKARFKCEKCGHEFDHGRDFFCPECGSMGRLVEGTGKEFMIESIVY